MQKGYWCVSNQNGRLRPGGSAHYPLHRLIYETAHGLVLPRSMVVHHINGDPLDNRIENLEALTRAEHPTRHQPNRRPGERLCAICRDWKPEDAFQIDSSGKHHSYCRACKLKEYRKWIGANQGKIEEYRGRRNTKYRQEHPGARVRLTDDQVRAIRVDSRPGREVASAYGISRWHVWDIKAGRKRADVSPG